MAHTHQEENYTFPFVIQGKSTPHIAFKIFELLDQNTLLKCRKVSSVWKENISLFPFVINGEFTPHIANRILGLLDQNTLLKCREVSKIWMSIVDNRTSLWDMVSPQVYMEAARQGKLDICRLFIQYAEDKNPADVHGWTPLHGAASNGQAELCHLIISNIDNKNPADKYGMTPLHMAANGADEEVANQK